MTMAESGARKPIRILIVENNEVLRKGLADLLNFEEDMEVTGTAGTVSEAFDLLEAEIPNLIILDISLSGVSGLDLLKDLNRRYGDIPILVLSMHEESYFVERALRYGARGYLIKQDAPENVVQAIHRVLSGDSFLSAGLKVRAARKGLAQK